MGSGCLSINSFSQALYLDETHKEFLKEFRAELEKQPEEIQSKMLSELPETLASVAKEFGAAMFDTLRQDSEKMVDEDREGEKAFGERNTERWKLTFQYLRAIYRISAEVGPMTIQGLNQDREYQNCPKLHALISLHARSLRISAEAICLMENGFADGALARWRSLHELSVVAAFILPEERIVAERYVASRHIAAYKAAVQYKEYEGRANLQPFGDEEIAQLKIQHDNAVESYSLNPKVDWGWSSEVLGIPKPNFSMLEKHVGLDHWRPRVKWASQEIHGAFVPNGVGLGVSESEHAVHLVGASNSGMSDPAQMIAISLTQVTTALLTLEPSLDRIAALHAMNSFVDEIGRVVKHED